MRRHLISILLATAFWLPGCGHDDGQTNQADEDVLQVGLTETGELQAVQSKVIAMPSYDWDYGRPLIVALESEGTLVNKGDVVGQIDTSGVVRILGQKRADLEIARADLQKLKVEHSSQLKKLEAELQSAGAAYQQAQIDTQRVRFESDTKKEVSRLQLAIAEITYNKAKRKLESTAKVQEEEIRIQQAKIRQTIGEIEKAKRTIERFSLRAPSDGMVVYRNKRRDQKVAVGDQMWPGQAIIELPDMSQMKALTTVSETDVEKVSLGQSAEIRLDAFPRKSYKGKISMVSKICREKDKDSNQKVFDVEILLSQSDILLRPGMTVRCEM